MQAWSRFMHLFAVDKSGATAVEYGLIASLIVLVVLAGMQAVGGGTTAMYGVITTAMGAV
jgi:pilus assembly protein Flp/PilA